MHTWRYGKGRYFLRLPGSQVAARRVYLHAGPDTDEVEYITCSVHPADLVGQARPFYKFADREGLVALAEDDQWEVEPNLHLSFRGTHLVYTSAEPDVAPYLDYWTEHRNMIGRVSGVPKMNDAVNRLRDDGWFTDRDVEQFEEEFVQKRGSFVDICPGLSLRTYWPIPCSR